MTSYLLLSLLFSLSTALPLVGWHLNPPWESTTVALLPTTLLHIPILLKNSDEIFLLAQGRFGSDTEGDAISPIFAPSSSSRILTFKYAKVGAAELQILLKEENVFRLIDFITEQTSGKWRERTTIIPAGKGEQQLFFRARGILDGFDAVTISSVNIKSSSSSVLAVPNKISKGIRRKPISKKEELCESIHCSFYQSSCQWTFQGFVPLDGKIISKENGLLGSEAFLHSSNSHFQMEIFVSDTSSVSVYQKIGSEEKLLWTAGVPLSGWNTIRLPLHPSAFPSKISIQSTSLRGGYIAIRSTQLVDEFGTEQACGGNVPPIRPKSDGTIRLTAVQKVEPDRPITPMISRQIPLIHSLFSTTSVSRLTTTSRPPSTSSTNFMKTINVNEWKDMEIKHGATDKAILPVNEPAGYLSKTTELFSPTGLKIPASLQKAFADKLSHIPPTTLSRETRPFSRQNIDWVVQHAFNEFMNKSRP